MTRAINNRRRNQKNRNKLAALAKKVNLNPRLQTGRGFSRFLFID